MVTSAPITYPYPAIFDANYVPATDGGDTVVYEPADPNSGTYPRIHDSNNEANFPESSANTEPIDPYTPAADDGGGGGAADPNVGSLSPNTGTVGTPITVTVTGTNFESGATVEVNQAAVPTTFVSPTQLTATFTPAAAGTSTLTVRQGSEESNDVTFTVT